MTTRPTHTISAVLLILAIFLLGASGVRAEEHYFTFTIQSRTELDTLTRVVSIDNVSDTVVYAYATDVQLQNLTDLGYTYTLLQHPGDIGKPRMTSLSLEATEWDAYPTFDAYKDMMAQYAVSGHENP